MRARPWILFGILISVVATVTGRSEFSSGVPSVRNLQKVTVAGISVELPDTPEPFQMQVPPEIQNKIVSMENFRIQKKNFLVTLTKVTYTPDIEGNVDGAVEGSVSNIQAKQGMTKVGDQRSPTTVSGIAGKRYSAEFNKDGLEFELLGVIVAKGPTLWQVFTFYKKGSKAHETASRIVNSVAITP